MATITSNQQRFDINWPWRADGRGYFAPCKDETTDIEQSIRHCLFVAPREQLFHMEGCDLRALVWEEDDLVFESLAGLMVKQALKRETRIVVEDVLVGRVDAGKGGVRVTVSVVYKRVNSKTSKNLSTSATYYRN